MDQNNNLQPIKKTQTGLITLPKELAQVVETGEIFRTQYDLVPAKSYECNKLSSFIKDHKENVFLSIEMLIAKMALNVNVKFNITPDQAYGIAQSIYKNYYFYSIEEVALVLRMGSDGELIKFDPETKTTLGKIFDRLSKDTILDWFKIYDERIREPFVDNSRSRMIEEHKSSSDDSLYQILGGENGIGKIINEMDKEMEEEKINEQNYKSWKEKYFKNKPDQEEIAKKIDEKK